MRLFKSALATIGVSAVLMGVMAAPALADKTVPVYGGITNVTTAAPVVPYLSDRGILMTPTGGATSDYVMKGTEVRQFFNFAIHGPSYITLEDNQVAGPVGSIVGGRIAHLGGIRFLHTHNGQKAQLGNFVVNLNKGFVFATQMNGDPLTKPVAVFRIVINDPPLYPVYNQKVDPTKAKVTGVTLFMTSGAATLLNSELKVKAFPTDGSLKFGFVVIKANLVR